MSYLVGYRVDLFVDFRQGRLLPETSGISENRSPKVGDPTHSVAKRQVELGADQLLFAQGLHDDVMCVLGLTL